MKHPVSELVAIADSYRHTQAEREREGPQGRWSRLEGARLEELSARYEQLLDLWVADEDERSAWRAHLYGAQSPSPEPPPDRDPPLFAGRSSDGGRLEVSLAEDGMFEVNIDGAVAERLPAWREGSEVVRGDIVYRECTSVPPPALEALQTFIGSQVDPPRQWLRALLEDGLIALDLSLTARGQRAIGRAGGPISRRPAPEYWTPPSR